MVGLLFIVLRKMYINYCVICNVILFVLIKIQGQTHQTAATIERSIAKGVLRKRTARGIIG